MKVHFISFHNGNLKPELLAMQKAVFDKLGIPLQQIRTKLAHADAIDAWLASDLWDQVCIFDADCIPLNRACIDYALENCETRIVSVAQKASHIPNSQVYAGPCFLTLSRTIFEKLGRPSFKATPRGDVAEELSYAARERGVDLELFWPSHVEKTAWPLTDTIMFGYGTTYADCIYHAFESSHNRTSQNRFIFKCRDILNKL